MNLPDGTVTFLFTDIEGSTRLWEEHPSSMRVGLARHDQVLRNAIACNNGQVFKTVGDAFCAAFAVAGDAARAANTAQLILSTEPWPEPIAIKVRMALHTGSAELRDHDYFGQPLNRVARLLAVGHGGQILLSSATCELCRSSLPEGTSLRSLGEHRLRDLSRPELVFQLCHFDSPSDFPPLRSLGSMPNNLPHSVTSFVGRQKEIVEVKALLERSRLVTVTGSGGSGKTRLTLQVAADLLDSAGDGVWLAELAAITEPSLVTQTVANVFGIREEPGKPLIQTLLTHFENSRLLLVLDNCEHLLDACASLAEAVLRHCAHVRILASSREPLGMGGELTYRIPSLSLPDLKSDDAARNLAIFESARLFIERAQLHAHQFTVTNRNAPAIASVCRRLDGIPLAIELAAARVRSMPVEEVDRRLGQSFGLLTGGSRTALPRQQTLRSLIDWSYDLLDEPERVLLSRLCAFSGGWGLEAVEGVCSGGTIEEVDVLDLLTSLIDKSLVILEEAGDVTRYRLLETVRQYARDRLSERGELEIWRGRHIAYFLAFAEGAEQHLRGAEQQVWLERLEADHDNLRAALAWCTEGPGDAELGLRLAGAIWRFWYVRGYFGEGRGWFSAVLKASAGSGPDVVRAKALNGYGVLSFLQNDFGEARRLIEESLVIWRDLGDQNGIASSLNTLGSIASRQGEFEAAQSFHLESLAIKREIGDHPGIASSLAGLGNLAYYRADYAAAREHYEGSLAELRLLGDQGGLAIALNNLGSVVHLQGGLLQARALHEESLAIRRRLGDRPGAAVSLGNLGRVAIDLAELDVAQACYEESQATLREIGDGSGIAESLEGLGLLAAARGSADRAACIWGAAERLREVIEAPLSPGERSRHEGYVRAARADSADPAAFDAAWPVGRGMTIEQAFDFALERCDSI
jgi:predicted ATPase/class 3 adenylate cyclase